MELGVKPKPGIPHRAINAILPFFGLVAAFIPLLFYSGARQAPWGGMGWDASTRNLMGNADPFGTLLWLGAGAVILQVVLYAVQYSPEWGGCLLTPSETIAAAIEGTKDLVECSIVLIFASAIGTISIAVMLPDVVVDLMGEVSGKTLPAIVFIISGFIALATGSSWTTMAIVFPIAIPLADSATGNTKLVITNTIAAVLGGATWGDHCSPISDTTVLSAAACRVKTIEHVKTQFPYAFTAGICAITLGFLLHGQGVPAELIICCALVVMPAIFYALTIPFGGPTGIYNPEVGAITGEGPAGSIASLKAFFKGTHAPAEERLAKKYSSKMFEDTEAVQAHPDSARITEDSP
jgi:Na+/H+ antiporter NhaC